MADMIHNVANYLHILAAIALLMKIWATQDCAGISGKTQFLYALVYTTRYLDLFSTYISYENSVGKILYLTLGYLTVLSIYIFFRRTHQNEHDTLRIETLMLACMVVALLMNHSFEVIEVFWTFSIYLEAVAILPQFHFIAKAKKVHKHVFWYILVLGIYKTMYLAHWGYQYYYYNRYDKITLSAGLVQFVLYCDFFARVFPYLEKKESTEEDCKYPVHVENGLLTSNISTIILTPASLVSSDDKANLLKAQEANATC